MTTEDYIRLYSLLATKTLERVRGADLRLHYDMTRSARGREGEKGKGWCIKELQTKIIHWVWFGSTFL